MPAHHLRLQTPANVLPSGRTRIYHASAVARVSRLPTSLTLRNYLWGAFTRSSPSTILSRLRRCPARQKLMFLRGGFCWKTVKGVAS